MSKIELLKSFKPKVNPSFKGKGYFFEYQYNHGYRKTVFVKYLDSVETIIQLNLDKYIRFDSLIQGSVVYPNQEELNKCVDNLVKNTIRDIKSRLVYFVEGYRSVIGEIPPGFELCPKENGCEKADYGMDEIWYHVTIPDETLIEMADEEVYFNDLAISSVNYSELPVSSGSLPLWYVDGGVISEWENRAIDEVDFFIEGKEIEIPSKWNDLVEKYEKDQEAKRSVQNDDRAKRERERHEEDTKRLQNFLKKCGVTK